jgi:ribosomal protein S21
MRYTYVKRGMAGIKMVIAERKRHDLFEEDIALKKQKEAEAAERKENV